METRSKPLATSMAIVLEDCHRCTYDDTLDTDAGSVYIFSAIERFFSCTVKKCQLPIFLPLVKNGLHIYVTQAQSRRVALPIHKQEDLEARDFPGDEEEQ